MAESDKPLTLVERVNAKLQRTFQTKVLGPIAARSGSFSRLLRFGPFRSGPVRDQQLHIARPSALGDVLMATAALRELKRRSPSSRVTFYTKFRELLTECPFIDHVADYDSRPHHAIELRYEDSIPPRRHIAKIFGDYLGVDVTDVRPWCAVDAQLLDRYRKEWRDLPRPLLVVGQKAGPWTPNKDWPEESWRELIGYWSRHGTVVEIGVESTPNEDEFGSYIDLRGRTSLAELVAAVAAADIHVGPISGPVHIAAALGIPSVVIYGGYEHPICSSYDGNINLYSAVECSPCWLREPCPFAKKCLTQISVAKVSRSIEKIAGRLAK